jgi:glycosyltransferase involved in cell wall biosynthesis
MVTQQFQDDTSPSAAGESTVAISVIIPAKNEERILGHCLEAIAANRLPTGAFEVILVDNGSTDRTLEIACAYGDKLNLRTLVVPGVHISALRNRGAREARGNILAFLDADCVPPETWLQNIVENARFGDRISGADYLIPPGSSWVARAWYDRGPRQQKTASFIPAGDLVVRREVFEQLGGFNEGIQTNEDVEFCRRARQAQLLVQPLESLAVVHLGTPQTLKAFFRKHHWHGTHVLRVFRQNFPSLVNLKPLAFAALTALSFLLIALGIVRLAITGSLSLFAAGVAVVLGSSMLLAGAAVVRRREWNLFVPMTALFVIYGAARAAALVDPRNW